jgi:hypothetical protein
MFFYKSQKNKHGFKTIKKPLHTFFLVINIMNSKTPNLYTLLKKIHQLGLPTEQTSSHVTVVS